MSLCTLCKFGGQKFVCKTARLVVHMMLTTFQSKLAFINVLALSVSFSSDNMKRLVRGKSITAWMREDKTYLPELITDQRMRTWCVNCILLCRTSRKTTLNQKTSCKHSCTCDDVVMQKFPLPSLFKVHPTLV